MDLNLHRTVDSCLEKKTRALKKQVKSIIVRQVKQCPVCTYK